MSALRWYAVGIDEIRDMFGADEQRAAALREIAAAALPATPPPKQPGLLGKLGPIFRRPPGETPLAPEQPRSTDLDDLIAGRHATPDRLAARWRLLEILVAGTAWGSVTVDLTDRQLNDLDFALARADVPSSLSPSALLDEDLRVGLAALPGLRVGFCHHPRAMARWETYRAATVTDPGSAEVMARITQWLSGFGRWGELAPGLNRPVPDLVAFFS